MFYGHKKKKTRHGQPPRPREHPPHLPQLLQGNHEPQVRPEQELLRIGVLGQCVPGRPVLELHPGPALRQQPRKRGIRQQHPKPGIRAVRPQRGIGQLDPVGRVRGGIHGGMHRGWRGEGGGEGGRGREVDLPPSTLGVGTSS